MDCSQRVTQGSRVYFTNSRDCCSILEKLDFSQVTHHVRRDSENSSNFIDLEFTGLKELCLFRRDADRRIFHAFLKNSDLILRFRCRQR